ncbi:MAG: autotransporter domain-containing protein [Paracoccus sp. (in: a-proteobacteria)]|nr:autotransporter domain-containing protein [Paracoccus sp. (in: a-proteobacteria)]
MNHKAQRVNHRALTRRRGGLLIAALMGSTIISAMPAQAACVVTVAPAWLCSGDNIATQTVVQNHAAVTTAAGFNVLNTAGGTDALDIEGAGHISYIDAHASQLFTTGGSTALRVVSTGNAVIPGTLTAGGSLRIETDGEITGSDLGILARNDSAGALVVITGGRVSGEGGIVAQQRTGNRVQVDVNTVIGTFYEALRVKNDGTGPTVVTASGSIFGESGGVYVDNAATATGAHISLASVSAAGNAVVVDNAGSGMTRVTSSGLISSSGGKGVDISNSGGGTLELELTEVEADDDAIRVGNHVAGAATDITVHGAITSANYYGIDAQRSAAGDTVIRTQAITAHEDGIYVRHQQSGATTITAGGRIESAASLGVDVDHRQNGNVSITTQEVESTDETIQVNLAGDGNVVIDAQGALTAIYRAMFVEALGNGDVEITTAAAVSGADGIDVSNDGVGDTRITTTGPVTVDADGTAINVLNAHAAGNNQIAIDTGALTGGHGVVVTVNGEASVDVHTRGTVTAAAANGYGIYVYGDTLDGATVTADGDIIANRGGIHVEAENAAAGAGGVTITANGRIEARDYGIDAVAWDQVDGITITAAEIEAGSLGIAATNYTSSATSITARGPIRADVGIFALNDVGASDITVRALGTIAAGRRGIDVDNDGVGQTLIVASGDISAVARGIRVLNGAATQGLRVHAAGVAVTQADGFALDSHNDGMGDTDVTFTGHVDGRLRLENGGTAGGMELVTASVNGDIAVQNGGNGATQVELGGHVNGVVMVVSGLGTTGTVLEADSITGSGDVAVMVGHAGTGALTVNLTGQSVGHVAMVADGNATGIAASIAGVEGGVSLHNVGRGQARLDASGPITGRLFALSEGDGEGLALRVGAVGGDVVLGGLGTGASTLVADGPITGSVVGQNAATASDLGITVTDVTGDSTDPIRGVMALNAGTGATRVTASGRVDGIVAVNGGFDTNNVPDLRTFFTDPNLVLTASGTLMAIDAQDVAGEPFGILALNTGTGPTDIATRGAVSGGEAAIRARSGQALTIRNTGDLRNASGAAGDLAILAEGGPVGILNENLLTGRVQTGAGDDVLTNTGTWRVGGTSDFGAGINRVENLGRILAAGNAALAEETAFTGLDMLNVTGEVSLADGAGGDVLRSDGDVTLAADSVFAIDIDAAAGADRISAAGAGMIDGAKLVVNTVIGLNYGQSYEIFGAAGGLTGNFVLPEGLPQTVFLTMASRYEADAAYLDVLQYRALADVAQTRNQSATATGLESLRAGPVFSAVVNVTDEEDARRAYDSLSGEAHASAVTAFVQGSHVPRDAAMGRLRQASPRSAPVMGLLPGARAPQAGHAGRFTTWAQVAGSRISRNGDGNAEALDHDARHVLAGGDQMVGDWRLGVLVGYSDGDFKVSGRASKGDAKSWHLGIYGGRDWDQITLRTGLIHSGHDIRTTRQAAYPGTVEQLCADYNARTTQAFAELAYGIDTPAARLEPFGGLAWVRHRSGAYTETGGAAALSSAAVTNSASFATLGIRAGADLAAQGVDGRLSGMVGWQRAFGDLAPAASHAFGGGDAFTVYGAPVARNTGLVELGLDMAVSPAAHLNIGYGGRFGSAGKDHSVRAGFSMRF